MANIVKTGNTWISLVLDSDWTSGFHNFASCKFKPSAANDRLVIKECPVDFGSTSIATANWPSIELYTESASTIACLFKGKRKSKLYIQYSACHFATPASASITFEIY
jgi:hypothetical protein